MANNSKNNRTRRTARSSGETRITLSRFSFWVVIAIGIAMAVSGFFNFFDWAWVDKACRWIQSLCFALGMIVPIILSYNSARSRGTAMFVLWIILVVLVAFGITSTIIGLIRSVI